MEHGLEKPRSGCSVCSPPFGLSLLPEPLSAQSWEHVHTARNIYTYTYVHTYAYIYPYFYVSVYLHIWTTPGSCGYFQFSASRVHLSPPTSIFLPLFSNCKKPDSLCPQCIYSLLHPPRMWSSTLLTCTSTTLTHPSPLGCLLLDYFQFLVYIKLNSDMFFC